ncbi:MAG: cytochrome P450 [Myxococcales bacterium]|nr:cytochrome P450 [Myxococcales bacterium]
MDPSPELLPQVPVAPRRLPLLGHVPWMIADFHDFIRETQRALGPIFWIGHRPRAWMLIVTGEPGLELLRSREASAERESELGYVFANTMMFADDDRHRRLRGSMRQPFSIKGLTATGAGERTAEVIDARIAGWVDRRELEIMAETKSITLDVIFRLIGVPSEDLGSWRIHYQRLILGALPSPGELPGTPRWWSRRSQAWIDQGFARFVAQTRASGVGDTLLGSMLAATAVPGQGLSPAEIEAQLRFLGLAGHETSASTMAWALLHLGCDRPRWDRLCAEATAADDPPVGPSDLRRFP